MSFMLATLRACWLSWSHRFETFTVVIMSWLTATEYLCHKWQRICSTCRKQFSVLSFFITWLITGICNTMDATSGAGNAYPLEAPEFNPDVLRGSCCSIFSFLCSFLDCFLYFFTRPLCCLSVIDLRILIPLWYLQTLRNARWAVI